MDMVPTYNVSDIIANPKLLKEATLARPMTPEERKSSIKLEEWKALVNHVKDIGISLFALIAVSLFIYICISTLYNPAASVDDKKWATSVVTLIASGTVGYLTGKSSK
ncbi:MAG: hypothetical protein HYZ25_20070 [Chloroflexi bacterium]|nr:hypothetical protein [Chloroflexota bacterium]